MMTEIRQKLQRLDTLSLIVLLLLILAAAMSFGNIKDFFSSHETDPITIWAGALFFSAVLIVLSWALSEVTPQFTFAYGFMVFITVGFALLSGLFQTTMYIEHRPNAGLINYAAGFGIPLLGEVGLAVVAVLFRKMEQRRRLTTIQEEMADGVQYVFAEAMRSVDPELIKTEVQREVRKFARTMIATTLEDMYTELSANRKIAPQIEQVELNDPVQNQRNVVESAPKTEEAKRRIEQMHAAKQSKIEQRRQQLLRLVEQGEMAVADVLSQLGVSENTIRNDVRALHAQGYGISISNGMLGVGLQLTS